MQNRSIVSDFFTKSHVGVIAATQSRARGSGGDAAQCAGNDGFLGLFRGAAVRSLPLSTQHHTPYTVIVLVDGDPREFSPVMLQLVTLAPLNLAELLNHGRLHVPERFRPSTDSRRFWHVPRCV